MKSEIELRRQATALHLQGWNKSEIARKLQRSRPWVDRWISRYTCTAPNAVRCKCRSADPPTSLQDHSRAPKHAQRAYPERVQKMVNQIRVEREAGKRARYQYALVGAQAIYYELQDLHISLLPPSHTIHRWLRGAGQSRLRKSQKPPNLTYPMLPCKAVNDVQELDFKGPFSLSVHWSLTM